jgi:hypothetical protein
MGASGSTIASKRVEASPGAAVELGVTCKREREGEGEATDACQKFLSVFERNTSGVPQNTTAPLLTQ